MILMHQSLFSYLPDKMLLAMHRICCHLRGEGWDESDENSYVRQHPYSWLFYYHRKLLIELCSRDIKFRLDWSCENYRGRKLKYIDPSDPFVATDFKEPSKKPLSKVAMDFWNTVDSIVYPEQDNSYMLKCISLLEKMGVKLVNGKSLSSFRLQVAIQEGI